MNEKDKHTQDELILLKYEMAEVHPELADIELDTPVKAYMYILATVALTGVGVTIEVEHQGKPERLMIENLGKTSNGEAAAIAISSESGNQELSDIWGSIAEKLMNSMFADDDKTTDEA